jgi:two-component system, OmpR family, sensor kinase
MARAWRGSLRARLMVGVVLLAALGMVLVNIASLTALRLYLVDVADADLTRASETLQRRVESRDDPITTADLGTLVPGAFYAALFDEHGRLVTQTSAHSLDGQPIPRPELPTPVPDGFAERAVNLPVQGAHIKRYRALGVPLGRAVLVEPRPGASPEAVTSAVIAASLGPSDAVVFWLVGFDIVATLAALAGIALLGRWVLRVGMAPLRDMATTATAIAAGNITQRIEITSNNSEIDEVGSALNRAFDARQRSDERLRQFVADASHELRTPLTSIRGWAQLHLHGMARDPVLVARAMQRIEEESLRMHSTVEELLQLARLDQGRPLDAAPVDLAGLAAHAVADARALAPDRSVTVDVPDEVFARGDADRLLQVLRNLLDNAVRYTPAGTPVSVAVRALPGAQVELTVTDQGPGMGPDTASKIFERFYRGNETRGPGGSGLGLSIVRSIVEAHGGTVTVQTAPGEGSRFTVTLPAAR